jgi:hypothetical protein
MKKFVLQIAVLPACLSAAFYLTYRMSSNSPCFSGMCDASAVVSLDDGLFAVADDEDSVIRVYSRHAPGRSVHMLSVAPFLGLPRRGAEVDLEGAARLGNHIYWISSHACNAQGKEQPSRRRFFATTGSVSNGVVDLRPVGKPYAGLLEDLICDPRLAPFDLANASRRMPKSRSALNIEALCATPEGHLLIGFRNPIPGGRALIVPLLNPEALVAGTHRARFGEPILLNLGGLGLRGIAYRHDCYWLVAGSYGNERSSRLYQWHGGEDVPRPLVLAELEGLNPEAVTFFNEPEGDQLWVASDDGTVRIGGVECKRLKDSRAKRFRAVSIPVAGVMTAK